MATRRQELVVGKILEYTRKGQPYTLGAVLVESGYSPETAKAPTQVTESKGFLELLEERMPDDLLQETHLGLLKTTKIEHMVFVTEEGSTDPKTGEKLTDNDIKAMLEEVNCKVKRIVHSETARHVYYWVADARARADALKLAYDVKGKLGKNNNSPSGNQFNTFIQNNNVNPNSQRAKELAENTIKILMEQTKRVRVDNNTTQND